MVQEQKISVIIPVFNEIDVIDTCYERLTAVMSGIDEFSYELVFVDDGSKDKTFYNIKFAADLDPVVRGISFSRNFGHQIALLAGLQHAKGRAVITMDGDLQHPPEIIPQLIDKWTKGFDIVNTVRIDPPEIGKLKKLTSKWFYTLINKLAQINIQPASADFRLMTRRVVDAFLQIDEHDRFTRGLISWMGFKQTAITYKANARLSGQSKYSLSKIKCSNILIP